MATLEIVPSSVVLVPDYPVEFEAIARDADGNPFNPITYEEAGYDLEWSWAAEALSEGSPVSDGVFLTGDEQNPTTLTVTNLEIAQVTLTVAVTYGPLELTAQVIAMLEAATYSPPPFPDRVQTAPAQGNVGVFLNGCTLPGTSPPDPDEAKWLKYEFTNLVDLAENLTENNCDTEAEFAVFSTGFRPILFLNEDSPKTLDSKRSGAGLTNPEWTDAVGDLLESNKIPRVGRELLSAQLYPFATSVNWSDQVPNADQIFKDTRAGFSFNGYQPSTVTITPTDDPGACNETYVKSMFNIDPAAFATPTLFVLFVKGIGKINAEGVAEIVGASPRGQTCAAWGNAQVVFVDVGSHVKETLAHEFGHVLGHRTMTLPWDHTGVAGKTRLGFQPDNLMHVPYNPPPSRDHLTFGQSFRMHVDPESWYQVYATAYGFPDRQPERDCGSAVDVDGSCPRIDR